MKYFCCWDNGERFYRFLMKINSLPKERKQCLTFNGAKLKTGDYKFWIDNRLGKRRFNAWIHLSNSPLSFVDTIRMIFIFGNFKHFLCAETAKLHTIRDLYCFYHHEYDWEKQHVLEMLSRVMENRKQEEARKFRKNHIQELRKITHQIDSFKKDMYYFLKAFSETDFRRISSQVMGTTRVRTEEEKQVVQAIELIRQIKSFEENITPMGNIIRQKVKELAPTEERYYNLRNESPLHLARIYLNIEES